MSRWSWLNYLLVFQHVILIMIGVSPGPYSELLTRGGGGVTKWRSARVGRPSCLYSCIFMCIWLWIWGERSEPKLAGGGWGRCKPPFILGYFWEHLKLISGDIIELLIDHHRPISWSALLCPHPNFFVTLTTFRCNFLILDTFLFVL